MWRPTPIETFSCVPTIQTWNQGTDTWLLSSADLIQILPAVPQIILKSKKVQLKITFYFVLCRLVLYTICTVSWLSLTFMTCLQPFFFGSLRGSWAPASEGLGSTPALPAAGSGAVSKSLHHPEPQRPQLWHGRLIPVPGLSWEEPVWRCLLGSGSWQVLSKWGLPALWWLVPLSNGLSRSILMHLSPSSIPSLAFSLGSSTRESSSSVGRSLTSSYLESRNRPLLFLPMSDFLAWCGLL